MNISCYPGHRNTIGHNTLPRESESKFKTTYIQKRESLYKVLPLESSWNFLHLFYHWLYDVTDVFNMLVQFFTDLSSSTTVWDKTLWSSHFTDKGKGKWLPSHTATAGGRGIRVQPTWFQTLITTITRYFIDMFMWPIGVFIKNVDSLFSVFPCTWWLVVSAVAGGWPLHWFLL